MNACSGAGSCPQPFVADQWRGAAHGTSTEVLRRRWCMHESLVQAHLRTGMAREDVLAMLGPPYYAGAGFVSYFMSPGGVGADNVELRISFAGDGTLAAVKTSPG